MLQGLLNWLVKFVDLTNNVFKAKVVSVAGTTTTALNAVTASTLSSELDLRGYTKAAIEVTLTGITAGNWTVDVQSIAVSGGTVGDAYDITNGATPAKISTGALNANMVRTFILNVPAPGYIKINATKVTDGACTVKITPFN